ncbi:MAG: PstS family phosphate ABC transporter substrate-binding protein [Planctomycetota bacterium]|nr:MAG: PstS family phosphate ABC transporter substrate-binding protein [Planctomycetota bacterium]
MHYALRIPASLLLLAVATTLAAAAPQDSATKNLKGAIKIDGSSTVYPITEAVAEEFRKTAPRVRPTVGISGTGGGFKRFQAGEIDISDASRPIKKSEADACAKLGIDFLELPIAFDGLSIVVHPKNSFANQLTVENLKTIFSATTAAKTWKEVNSEWPATPIKVYMPGTDSGTFDYFKEVVLGKDGKARSDASVSEDDNALVRGVAGDEGAIGFFGCAYYFENKDVVRCVPIVSPKGDAVSPTKETIETGTYAPFSRPLFIYVSLKSVSKPEIVAFVDYYIENAGKYAEEVGFVKLPDSMYALVKANWIARKTGSQFFDAEGKSLTGALETVYK